MAIKTITADSSREIDKKVNEFMKEKGEDMPVRQSILYNGENLTFVYLVFYDDNKDPTERAKNAVNGESYKNKSGGKVGSLWSKGDNYEGKLKGKPIKITGESWSNKFNIKEMKNGGYMRVGEIAGTKIRIIPNQFKKGETDTKKPDFIIMEV